jgi:hypothetical protein
MSLSDTEDALLWVELEPITPHIVKGFSQVSDVICFFLVVGAEYGPDTNQ